MCCNDWLPDHIKNDDNFLDPNLIKLRDYVLNNRNEDISFPLYAFENRVLFSFYLKELSDILGKKDESQFLGWECIRNFEYEAPNGSITKRTIEKRLIQSCFLRGYLEVNFWNRGDQKKQIIYKSPPSIIENSMSDCFHQFIYEESVEFSYKAMKKFWKKYLNVKPGKRKRIVFFQGGRSKTKEWHVFVIPELWTYYYGKKAESMKNKTYVNPSQSLPGSRSIRFEKVNESKHAAIANFDSWQTFIHVHYTGDKSMKNTILGCFQMLQKEALNDSTRLLNNIKEILKKIATETGISGLNAAEWSNIQKAAESSPKVRLLIRMTQQIFIRSKIAEYFYLSDNSQQSIFCEKKQSITDSFSESLRNKLIQFSEWISPVWEPDFAGQPVTAADIPEQTKYFKMTDGEIKLSCMWRAQYGEKPAYIRVKWDANISSGYEIWIAFFNPETKSFFSEVPLGTHLNGGTVIQSQTLKFDPSCERWAASVVLKKGNINGTF